MIERKDVRVNALFQWNSDLSVDRFFAYPCKVTEVNEISFKVVSFQDLKEKGPIYFDEGADKKDLKSQFKIVQYQMQPCTLEEVDSFIRKRFGELNSVILEIRQEGVKAVEEYDDYHDGAMKILKELKALQKAEPVPQGA